MCPSSFVNSPPGVAIRRLRLPQARTSPAVDAPDENSMGSSADVVTNIPDGVGGSFLPRRRRRSLRQWGVTDCSLCARRVRRSVRSRRVAPRARRRRPERTHRPVPRPRPGHDRDLDLLLWPGMKVTRNDVDRATPGHRASQQAASAEGPRLARGRRRRCVPLGLRHRLRTCPRQTGLCPRRAQGGAGRERPDAAPGRTKIRRARRRTKVRRRRSS